VPEAEAAAVILAMAAGEISEESLTRWIRDNWPAK
jgi:death-on-curing protein